MKRLPSKDEVIAWLDGNPSTTSLKDVIKAFGVKGAARLEFKHFLRALKAEGAIELQGRGRRGVRGQETLPSVLVVDIIDVSDEGELIAVPFEREDQETAAKIILTGSAVSAVTLQDRALVRLSPSNDELFAYSGRVIRKIEQSADRVLGVFKISSEGGRVSPVEKNNRQEWMIPAHLTAGAQDGELVEIEQIGSRGRLGLLKAKVQARLGSPFSAKSISLIAIHQHGLRDRFEPEVIQEAERIPAAPLGNRLDLRDMPFVTIDPHDARDHDDACFVAHDTDPKNKGGFVLWVAIADIAHYVRPQSPLDREAKLRGNSTYFPDRVVPMLPDRLSGDLCSLHEHVERAAIVAEIQIDGEGQKLGQKFHRAMICSQGSLTYDEVQKAVDGQVSARLAPMMEDVIAPLYAAYEALKKARHKRQPLELDLPERQIVLSDEGQVTSVNFKARFDAHKMIEEFMVLANVAAAQTLLEKKTPLLFRVHDEPHLEKIEALREVAQSAGFKLTKSERVTPAHLNRLLSQARGSDHDTLINMSALRSMTQAYYHPEHAGHYGLALRSYAHFTSPIRRYADLIVHRALVSAHGWGDDGLSEQDIHELTSTAQEISQAERRSMTAERDTNDRYLAAFLSEKTGTHLEGRISGVASFGAFVRLEETGADALVPMRNLGREYFIHDRDAQCLIGERSRLKIMLGDRVVVKLLEVDPATGGLVGDLFSLKEKAFANARPSRKGGAKGRKSSDKKRKAKSKLKSRQRKRE